MGIVYIREENQNGIIVNLTSFLIFFKLYVINLN